jgi:probable F420-dependent oxidoreductase
MKPFRVGVQLHPQHTSIDDLRAAWEAADALGVDSIWTWDHFFPLYGDDSGPHFEGWSLLAARAVTTAQARFGMLVTGNPYRNPELLADMARTVDHISGGRVILGVGAGWYEKDYTTYGYEYGTWKSRFDLFDEGLLRVERRLEQLNPAPVRDIPILIGGSGTKRTIPAVAKHADIWHTFLPIDKFKEASKLVAELAEANGRKDSDVERSSVWENAGDADAYRESGVTLFTTEIHPDADGYDFGIVDQMVKWRDG